MCSFKGAMIVSIQYSQPSLVIKEIYALKKYVPALLSHMQVYKIMLYPLDKFSY